MENLRAAGIFMAVAAGNRGPGCGTIDDPPGLDAAAITIGAATLTDAIANFSSRGPVTVDGSNRRKPDLVAPGVSIRSAVPDNSYAFKSGTSMAAPHVAGAVALLWSAFPHLRGNVDDTQLILQESALALTTTQGCGGDTSIAVPNNVFGYGRIDLLAAYNLIEASRLQVRFASNTVVVSWSSAASNFALEQTSDFRTWTQVEQTPEDSSTNKTITISPPSGSLFFRLKR